MMKKSVKRSSKNTSPNYFINAFQRRLGCTPTEYIDKKLKAGSQLDAVKYLFDVIAAEVALQNNCKCFHFDYFYKKNNAPRQQTVVLKPNTVSMDNKPENAGKFWTKDEERMLIKMFNDNASKSEMCAAFKRTEIALAARLVKLGVIQDRDEFIGEK